MKFSYNIFTSVREKLPCGISKSIAQQQLAS